MLFNFKAHKVTTFFLNVQIILIEKRFFAILRVNFMTKKKVPNFRWAPSVYINLVLLEQE